MKQLSKVAQKGNILIKNLILLSKNIINVCCSKKRNLNPPFFPKTYSIDQGGGKNFTHVPSQKDAIGTRKSELTRAAKLILKLFYGTVSFYFRALILSRLEIKGNARATILH